MTFSPRKLTMPRANIEPANSSTEVSLLYDCPIVSLTKILAEGNRAWYPPILSSMPLTTWEVVKSTERKANKRNTNQFVQLSRETERSNIHVFQYILQMVIDAL